MHSNKHQMHSEYAAKKRTHTHTHTKNTFIDTLQIWVCAGPYLNYYLRKWNYEIAFFAHKFSFSFSFFRLRRQTALCICGKRSNKVVKSN